MAATSFVSAGEERERMEGKRLISECSLAEEMHPVQDFLRERGRGRGRRGGTGRREFQRFHQGCLVCTELEERCEYFIRCCSLRHLQTDIEEGGKGREGGGARKGGAIRERDRHRGRTRNAEGDDAGKDGISLGE